jgi:hypothetical protein
MTNGMMIGMNVAGVDHRDMQAGTPLGSWQEAGEFGQALASAVREEDS